MTYAEEYYKILFLFSVIFSIASIFIFWKIFSRYCTLKEKNEIDRIYEIKCNFGFAFSFFIFISITVISMILIICGTIINDKCFDSGFHQAYNIYYGKSMKVEDLKNKGEYKVIHHCDNSDFYIILREPGDGTRYEEVALKTSENIPEKFEVLEISRMPFYTIIEIMEKEK